MNIKLTELAQEELRKQLQSKDNRSLRLYVAGMGWGGPTFGIALDEQKDGDEVIKVDDFTFLLDEDMRANFDDFNIDYSNNWLRRGFNIRAGRGGSSC